MPTSPDRLPRTPTRTRRAMGGIGQSFIPYTGALYNVNLGAFDLTTTGVITGEQITSTDDITMQGHLLTLGDGTATDIVISFSASANDATITFDESDDEFDFGDAAITTTGTLSAGALTITSVILGDNQKIVLGDGSDAEIYYDTVNLIIDPDAVGSGKVLIGTTGDGDLVANDISAINSLILSVSKTITGAGGGLIHFSINTGGNARTITFDLERAEGYPSITSPSGVIGFGDEILFTTGPVRADGGFLNTADDVTIDPNLLLLKDAAGNTSLDWSTVGLIDIGTADIEMGGRISFNAESKYISQEGDYFRIVGTGANSFTLSLRVVNINGFPTITSSSGVIGFGSNILFTTGTARIDGGLVDSGDNVVIDPDNLLLKTAAGETILDWSAAGIADFDDNAITTTGGITAGALVNTEGRIVNTTRIIAGQSPYTMLVTDHTIFCDTDAGTITVNLLAGVNGTAHRIINCGNSNNNLTITPDGAELLLGANNNFTLLDGEILTIVYETTEGWW